MGLDSEPGDSEGSLGSAGRRPDAERAAEGVFVGLLVAAQPRLFGYIVTMLHSLHDAEEVMQETTMLMWEKLSDFNLPAKPTAEAVDELVAWGNQIAYFKVLNHRRKKTGKAMQLSTEMMQLISDEWSRRDQSGLLEQRRVALRTCLSALPELQRDLLEQYYWKKRDVKEIAARSSKTPDAVYKLLQRVRGMLYACIGERMSQQQA